MDNRPIVLIATLLNTGTTPISYWLGGPGRYPAAEHFKIVLTDANGQLREVAPTNGQCTEGSGTSRTINPGDVVEIPLAIPPPPDGIWSVQVRSDEESFIDPTTGKKFVDWPAIPASAPVKIEVKKNPAIVARWDQQLLSDVRRGDPFARHLATNYHNDFVINGVIGDLAGNDAKLALEATRTLFDVQSLPPSAEFAIESAIDNQLALLPFRADVDLVAMLLGLSGRFPTNAMLTRVLAVAHAPFQPANDDQIHYQAVGALRYFPQSRAIDALNGFATDPSPFIRDAAKAALQYPIRPTTSKSDDAWLIEYSGRLFGLFLLVIWICQRWFRRCYKAISRLSHSS